MSDFDLFRKVVAHMTTQSWREIPHVAYVYEPDVTDFYREFQRFNRNRREKISLNTLILKVVAEGLKQAPALNAKLRYNDKTARGRLEEQASIHVAIPWLLSDGQMITPVVADVGNLSLEELSGAVALLADKIERTDMEELLTGAALAKTYADFGQFKFGGLLRILASLPTLKKRQKSKVPDSEKLLPKDLLSATITVSNIGSLYKEQQGYFALLEIVPPQVCAIGVGALSERAGVVANRVAVRTILPMCIAFDHRGLDFNEVIPFLKALDHIFAHPELIRTW